MSLDRSANATGGNKMFDFDPDEHIKRQRKKHDIFKYAKIKNRNKIEKTIGW